MHFPSGFGSSGGTLSGSDQTLEAGLTAGVVAAIAAGRDGVQNSHSAPFPGLSPTPVPPNLRDIFFLQIRMIFTPFHLVTIVQPNLWFLALGDFNSGKSAVIKISTSPLFVLLTTARWAFQKVGVAPESLHPAYLPTHPMQTLLIGQIPKAQTKGTRLDLQAIQKDSLTG